MGMPPARVMSARRRTLSERIARSATPFELGESGAEVTVEEKPSCASARSTDAAINEVPPSVWMLRRPNDDPRIQWEMCIAPVPNSCAYHCSASAISLSASVRSAYTCHRRE